MNDMLTKLADQLYNPVHCHVRYGGDLLRHHPNPHDPEDLHALKDQPIRFTRLAAGRIINQLHGARIEEMP